MNPPKCPACGHEHWQIEGCGPALVEVPVHGDISKIASMPGFGLAPPRDEGAINDDPTRGGVPPEDLAAYDAIHRAETRTDYVNAIGNVPSCQVCLGSGQDPDSKGIADCPVCNGSGLAHSGELPKALTGLAAAVAQDERMYGASLVKHTEDGAERINPVGVPLGFPLGGTSKDATEFPPLTNPFIGDQITLQKADSDALHRIRKGLKMSQPKFGETFGIAPGTLRGWENGRHKIPPYVMVLLKIIGAEPKAVFRALGVKV